MKRRISTYAASALALCLPAVAAVAAPEPWRQAPPPGWVNVSELPSAAPAPVEAGASDYLLVDHQVRLGEVTEHYERYVQRLVSQSDVDEGAQLSIEIDPEHDRILLHAVRVSRDGHDLDKLADARHSLLNQERELADGLINGRVTLHLLFQDLRVGDVLDYSYTVVHRDPFAERGYNDWFSTQWSVPVRAYQLRLLRPEGRTVRVQDHGALGAPVEKRAGGWVETRWHRQEIPALASEDSHPSWFFQYPRIEISEFADWNAVRAWSLPMYAATAKRSAAFDELVARFRAKPDESARILAALRFVQDDIRYTGLEIGAGAYRPTPPDVVLARRYGDCKDKVLLFVTLLRALGVEAAPALVNAHVARGTADRLPGPNVFDHVIAKVRHAGHDYWLDATASGQGGGLDDLVQADFGVALVLAPQAQGLDTIPPRDGPKPFTRVVETYDFRAGTGKPARLEVQSTYRDEEADSMRVKMRGTTATQLGRDYLEYYRKSYPGIRSTAALTWSDDREKNQFVTHESYEIDAPFQKEDDGERKFYLEAYLITERTGQPKQAMRTTPLARAFPMHVRHEIVAYLPGEWHIEGDGMRVRNPEFEYESKIRFHGGKLELAYDLRNTRDHVTVEGMKEFLAELDKVHDDAFYTLTDGDDAKPGATATGGARRPNVGFLGALFAGLGFGAWLAGSLWRRNPRVRPAAADAPAGISGWLVVPGIQALLAPVAIFAYFSDWATKFGDDSAFVAQSAGMQAAILGGMCLLGTLFVTSGAQLGLLFRRRSAFPLAFIVMKCGFVAWAVLALVVAVADGEWALVQKAAGALVAALASAGAWIAYIRMSQRVRATFVRDTRGAYPVTPPAAAPAAA